MIGAHQNLNSSHDLTTPFHGWFVICGLGLAITINISTKFDVLSATHYNDTKGDTKYRT